MLRSPAFWLHERANTGSGWVYHTSYVRLDENQARTLHQQQGRSQFFGCWSWCRDALPSSYHFYANPSFRLIPSTCGLFRPGDLDHILPMDPFSILLLARSLPFHLSPVQYHAIFISPGSCQPQGLPTTCTCISPVAFIKRTSRPTLSWKGGHTGPDKSQLPRMSRFHHPFYISPRFIYLPRGSHVICDPGGLVGSHRQRRLVDHRSWQRGRMGQSSKEACLCAVGLEGKTWRTKLAPRCYQVDQECFW